MAFDTQSQNDRGCPVEEGEQSLGCIILLQSSWLGLRKQLCVLYFKGFLIRPPKDFPRAFAGSLDSRDCCQNSGAVKSESQGQKECKAGGMRPRSVGEIQLKPQGHKAS